jgi:hypothetical protein
MGQPCAFQVGEPSEDFVARRTSWLAAYRQALRRRAAASASVNDGIPAQPTPGAAAAAAAVTTKKPMRRNYATTRSSTYIYYPQSP